MISITHDFLVCHDYGTGGLWWRISALSPSQIHEAYRDLEVFEEPPAWWTKGDDEMTPRISIDDEPEGALALLKR